MKKRAPRQYEFALQVTDHLRHSYEVTSSQVIRQGADPLDTALTWIGSLLGQTAALADSYQCMSDQGETPESVRRKRTHAAGQEIHDVLRRHFPAIPEAVMLTDDPRKTN